MKQIKRTVNQSPSRSMVRSAEMGLAAALSVSALLTLLLTSLIINGRLGEENGNALVFVIRILSVFVGGLIGASLAQGKYLPVISLVSLGYLIMNIALGIALYDGSFRNFIGGVMSVLIGGATACLIKLIEPKRQNRGVRRIK